MTSRPICSSGQGIGLTAGQRVRRPTLSEVAWPATGTFAVLAEQWAADATSRMLGWVWDGYERLIADLDSSIDAAQDAADLERDISQLLEPRVRNAMPDLVPFYIQHGVYERETRQAPPAQPPCYDLAFVAFANPRFMWPLEAKILKHDRDVNRYVADINEQFLTCRYAPFSSEGAMLGYLLTGDPIVAFLTIQAALGTKLTPYGRASRRPHRVSRHTRVVPRGKLYPSAFDCHHLMMAFAGPTTTPQSEQMETLGTGESQATVARVKTGRTRPRP